MYMADCRDSLLSATEKKNFLRKGSIQNMELYLKSTDTN